MCPCSVQSGPDIAHEFNHAVVACFAELHTLAPPPDRKGLEKLFRSKVLKLLHATGKITPGIITMLGSWKHSNVSRGRQRKENRDDSIPCIIEADPAVPARRRSWARLIQKIYEVDPLICPKCTASMKISSCIGQPNTVKHILQHPGLWERQMLPPLKTQSPPSDYWAAEHIPAYDCSNPVYHFEAYL